MKDLQQAQREGREKYVKYSPEIGDYIDNFEAVDLDQHTANTWKACLATILESGLFDEKKDCENCNDCEAMMSCPRKEGHNTLARDIKEFISNMDKV